MLLKYCVLLAALLAGLSPVGVIAQTAASAGFAERVATMRRIDGFLPLDWDAKAGKLYLEIAHPGAELLYTDSLPYGTGSNDLGLDRGQTAPARVVRFERQGPKVLLSEINERFRSLSSDAAEQLATRQSFPESVLWGFKVEAESSDGTLLVDATDFFLPRCARRGRGAGAHAARCL